jgi:hypothetical protein
MRNSLKILSNTSRWDRLRSSKDTPDIYTIALNSIIDPDTIKLTKELDGLPLILAITRVYLN